MWIGGKQIDRPASEASGARERAELHRPGAQGASQACVPPFPRQHAHDAPHSGVRTVLGLDWSPTAAYDGCDDGCYDAWVAAYAADQRRPNA